MIDAFNVPATHLVLRCTRASFNMLLETLHKEDVAHINWKQFWPDTTLVK